MGSPAAQIFAGKCSQLRRLQKGGTPYRIRGIVLQKYTCCEESVLSSHLKAASRSCESTACSIRVSQKIFQVNKKRSCLVVHQYAASQGKCLMLL